jgi:Tol biopolymer transport system component
MWRAMRVVLVLAVAGVATAETVSSANAAFPGKNGRIAFSRGLKAIYTVVPDGHGLTRLTDARFNASPAFSANGGRIVYQQSGRLTVMAADGGEKHAVAGADIEAIFPSWSPDGRTIAFGQFTDADAVWTIGETGEALSYLTGGTDPSWSPSGALIAYTARQGRCDGVYSIKPSGTGLRALIRPRMRGGHCNAQARHPDFSPAGHFVAYTRVLRRRVGGRMRFLNDIAIVNVRTLRRRLVTRSGRATQPAWSPDGRRLAYVQPDGLWTIRSDGTSAKRIVTGGRRPDRTGITGPSWQPRQ